MKENIKIKKNAAINNTLSFHSVCVFFMISFPSFCGNVSWTWKKIRSEKKDQKQMLWYSSQTWQDITLEEIGYSKCHTTTCNVTQGWLTLSPGCLQRWPTMALLRYGHNDCNIKLQCHIITSGCLRLKASDSWSPHNTRVIGSIYSVDKFERS